jgi:hypothetical protein
LINYTIERFEGTEWAVLQDDRGSSFNLPRSWLPLGAREGDVLRASAADTRPGSASVSFELDQEAREERLRRARSLRDRLPRSPKGDVSL